MNFVDINKINENINDAYNNQTEKVKRLFDDAQKKLDIKDSKEYYYTKNKNEVKHVYNLNRAILKNKEITNTIERKIDTKLNEMQNKLNINSKNLDFIFEKVSNNNKNQIELIKELNIKNQNSIKKNINKTYQKHEKVFQERQSEIEKKVDSFKEEIKDIVIAENENTKEILTNQNKILESFIEEQKDFKESVLNTYKESEVKIAEMQNSFETKLDNMQKLYESNSEELQNIKAMYHKEYKNSMSTLLQERKEYINEIGERDRQIRELNYKIFDIEEKLEREKEKRNKASIWNIFRKKSNYEEEKISYTTQILNYAYLKR